MKINRFDAHDRLQHFTGQEFDIGKSCQECINNRPPEFENHPMYVFAHKREIDLDERISMFNQDLIKPFNERQFKALKDVPNGRILWQSRLLKPKFEPNSMLFKAYPPTDVIRIIWMLPATELWDQFTKGKMTENKTVSESIYNYKTNRNKLEEKEDDDVSEETARKIYKQIARRLKQA